MIAFPANAYFFTKTEKTLRHFDVIYVWHIRASEFSFAQDASNWCWEGTENLTTIRFYFGRYRGKMSCGVAKKCPHSVSRGLAVLVDRRVGVSCTVGGAVAPPTLSFSLPTLSLQPWLMAFQILLASSWKCTMLFAKNVDGNASWLPFNYFCPLTIDQSDILTHQLFLKNSPLGGCGIFILQWIVCTAL